MTTDEEAEFERLMAADDAIGALCLLVKASGLTMRLHGVPVDATELRAAAMESAGKRMAGAISGGILARVKELLELAHGYALLGSFVAFRAACVELKLRGSREAMLAGVAIEHVRIARKVDGKPKREDYAAIIADALTYVETGTIPAASANVTPSA